MFSPPSVGVSHSISSIFGRYGGLYNDKNVAISGIHTHAGPGGYLQYVVYIVTSLGFVRQSFDVVVDGIEKSIIQAHENLRPGKLFVNKGNENHYNFSAASCWILHITFQSYPTLCKNHNYFFYFNLPNLWGHFL